MIVLEAMVALTADSMLEDFTSMNLAMQLRGPVRHLGPCACAGAVGLLGPLSQGEVVPLAHPPHVVGGVAVLVGLTNPATDTRHLRLIVL